MEMQHYLMRFAYHANADEALTRIRQDKSHVASNCNAEGYPSRFCLISCWQRKLLQVVFWLNKHQQ